MKTKITLLTIGAALLLTACGQVQSSPTETTLPPTLAVQEEVHRPQATLNPTMTAQEPDTAPITAQEPPQKENTHQEESAPQTANTLEPVAEPTFSEDISSETVHAKTGYIEPEPTPEPGPTPTPSAPADRQAAIDTAHAYAVTQYGVIMGAAASLSVRAIRRSHSLTPVASACPSIQPKAAACLPHGMPRWRGCFALLMWASTPAVVSPTCTASGKPRAGRSRSSRRVVPQPASHLRCI